MKKHLKTIVKPYIKFFHGINLDEASLEEAEKSYLKNERFYLTKEATLESGEKELRTFIFHPNLTNLLVKENKDSLLVFQYIILDKESKVKTKDDLYLITKSDIEGQVIIYKIDNVDDFKIDNDVICKYKYTLDPLLISDIKRLKYDDFKGEINVVKDSISKIINYK